MKHYGFHFSCRKWVITAVINGWYFSLQWNEATKQFQFFHFANIWRKRKQPSNGPEALIMKDAFNRG